MDKRPQEDSLKKRYIFKLFTNLLGVPIGLVTESIIPRGLGVIAYGNFSFISNFFVQAVTFIDLGTSNAFYTKLTKRPDDQALKKFYWNLVLILSFLLLVFVLGAILAGFQVVLWPDQMLKYIFMGLLYGLLYWYSQIVLKIVDSYARTREGEIIRMFQKVLRLVIIVPMFIFDWFTLDLFFIYNYFITLFSIVNWIRILHKHNIKVFPSIILTKEKIKGYAKEFYQYSAPLIVYSFITMFSMIFDRWILQNSFGSKGQGYFGLAFQVSTICFIFTSAMTPLIFREFSVALSIKDFERTRRLYKKYIPMLYAIAAYFGIFISTQADNVLYIVGGENYSGAYWSVVLMSFYPIHQTYGQLTGSLFYASENTKLYKNIGVGTMLAGLPFSFILISNNAIFGLNLGDIGLSIKMITFQFIRVNIMLLYNTKFLQTDFGYFFKHQILTLIYFLAASIISKELIDMIITNHLINFIASGAVYSAISVFIVFIKPQTVSLDRSEVKLYTRRIINFIQGNKS